MLLNAIYSIAGGRSEWSVSSHVGVFIAVAWSGASVCQCGLFVDVDVQVDASHWEASPQEVESGGCRSWALTGEDDEVLEDVATLGAHSQVEVVASADNISIEAADVPWLSSSSVVSAGYHDQVSGQDEKTTLFLNVVQLAVVIEIHQYDLGTLEVYLVAQAFIVVVVSAPVDTLRSVDGEGGSGGKGKSNCEGWDDFVHFDCCFKFIYYFIFASATYSFCNV